MEIGIFMPTGTRGYLTSATAPLNEPSWALNRDVIQAADRCGVDFALSMVKFRGFGGPSRYWDDALEPFTLIAALAATTTRIKLFPTAASLAMPPAVVARMAATLDQVAPGRLGLNLITGWQKAEYEQMGLWPGEAHFARRYDYLTEYVRVLRALMETGRCDLAGEFFAMTDCVLSPRPSNPVPIVVAGGSEAGLAFAARHCDYNFCAAPDTFNDPGACAGPIERLLNAAAQAAGRDVKALILVAVIAAATDADAMDRWKHYEAGTDLVALGLRLAQAEADVGNSDPHSTKARVQGRAPTPTSSMKLIGSYETVARLLDDMAAVPGIAGAMLFFDDFRDGIAAFEERIQPRMKSRA